MNKVDKPRKNLIVVYLLFGLLVPTAVVLVLLTLSQHPAKLLPEPTVLLSDHFSSYNPGQLVGNDSTWTYVSSLPPNNNRKEFSHWIYTLGKIYHQPNIPADYTPNPKLFLGSLVVAGQTDWDDYAFRVRAEPLGEEGFGLAFRYQNVNNFYRLVIEKDQVSSQIAARIDKEANGEVTTLTSRVDKVVIYQAGDWYRLQLVASGNSFKVSIDEQQILEVTDKSFPNGKVGLWAWKQSGVFFDDVLVTKI